ncbi:MAG: DNA polymerase III subunit delta' [Deltaproteobacteria bacterium]|nr:DNA polymerase III subunit delta' [Deltaproteobacteria bacterium]
MSTYESILGHVRQIGQLDQARLVGRVAHAYMFSGPDGVGKEMVAFAFAQALNCEADDDVPCGKCTSCIKISKGGHPDVRLVASEEELVSRNLLEPEKKRAPSAQIRNAQLDELADLFRHRPYLGRYKVVIVVDAHKMNINSQNRFLKTLEEPSSDSVIILLTDRPSALLSTVRSRCQNLDFGSISRDQITGVLQQRLGLDADRAGVLAAMAQGSLGRALFLAESDVLEMRDKLIGSLSELDKLDLEDLLSLAGEHGQNRLTLLEALQMLELWCRDVLVAAVGGGQQQLINLDKLGWIDQQAASTSPRRLVRWIERIRRTRGELKVNANPRMAMESLLLSMRSL